MKRSRRSDTVNSDTARSEKSATSSPDSKPLSHQQTGPDSELSTQNLNSQNLALSQNTDRRVNSKANSYSTTSSSASNDSLRTSFADVKTLGGGGNIGLPLPSTKRKRTVSPRFGSNDGSGPLENQMAVDMSSVTSQPNNELVLAETSRMQSAATEAETETSSTSSTPSVQPSESPEASTPFRNGHSSAFESLTGQRDQRNELPLANLLQPGRKLTAQRLLRLETPADSVGATSGPVTPTAASPTDQDQENDQDLPDEQNTASGKPAKQLKRLPGRRRAPHPDRNVEADLRRQLQLKVGYRAVAKALKPVLAELASRTIDSIQDDSEIHKASEQYRVVQSQLDARLRDRVNALDQTFAIRTKNAQEIRDNDTNKLRDTCTNIIKNLQEDYSASAEHQLLVVIRNAELVHDDGSMTVDEDGILPSLRGPDGPLPLEYDSRSRFFIEVERLWRREETRQSLANAMKKYLRENHDDLDLKLIQTLETFVGFDEAHREFAIASANVRALANAAEAIENTSPPPPSPQVISNEDAQALQVLADILLQSGPAQSGQPLDTSRSSLQRLSPNALDSYADSRLQISATPLTTSKYPAHLMSKVEGHHQAPSKLSMSNDALQTQSEASPPISSLRRSRRRRSTTHDEILPAREPIAGPRSYLSQDSSTLRPKLGKEKFPEEHSGKFNKITDILNKEVVIKSESPILYPISSPNGQISGPHVVSSVVQQTQPLSASTLQDPSAERRTHENLAETFADQDERSENASGREHQIELRKLPGPTPTKPNGFWNALAHPASDVRNKESASRQTRYEALLRSTSKPRNRTPEMTSSHPSDISSDPGRAMSITHPPRPRRESAATFNQTTDSRSPTINFRGHRSSNSVDASMRPGSRGSESAYQEKDRRASIAAPQHFASQTNPGTPRFSPLAPHPTPHQQSQFPGSPQSQQYMIGYGSSAQTQGQIHLPSIPSSSHYASPYNPQSTTGPGYSTLPATSQSIWQTSSDSLQVAGLPTNQQTSTGASFPPAPNASFPSAPPDSRYQAYSGFAPSPVSGPHAAPQISQVNIPDFGQQYGGQPILPASMDPRITSYGESQQYTPVTQTPTISQQHQVERSTRQPNDHRRPKSRHKNKQHHEFRSYSGPPGPRG